MAAKVPAQVIKRSIPRKMQGLYRPARYKAIYGGRGSSKSHSVADYLVTTGTQRRMRYLCAREIQKSLSTSVHQLLVDKIEDHGLQDAYKVTRDGIRGPHGTHFLFAGLRSNPDSVKSMEDLDGAWVEEADRCSQVSLDLLTPTVRKPGSELIFTWNRRNTTDPVDDLFLGGTPPPNSWVQQINWRDNPFFPRTLYDEMKWMEGRDRDKWLHIWEGHPLQRSEAKVFKHWTVDEMDELLLRSDATPRFGADWGFAIDPTVLIQVYAFPKLNKLYIRNEAYKVGCKIDETPALFAGDDVNVPQRWKNIHRHRGIQGVMRNRLIADGARPETIAHLRDRGFDITRAIKGAKSVEEGVAFMQDYDIVVHPSCTHTQDELALYEYKVDKHTDEITSELKDKDNHVIDAVRYAVEEMRRAGKRKGTYGKPTGVYGPGVVTG